MRHPLHPALVHFPIACWFLAVTADFANIFYVEWAWQWSEGLFLLGNIIATPALLTGLLEFSRIPEASPAMRDGYWHMGAMLLAFTLFTTRSVLGLESLQPIVPSAFLLGVDVVGVVFLAIGGWFGGRLVYGHGIGQK